jgi:hypothetical protein
MEREFSNQSFVRTITLPMSGIGPDECGAEGRNEQVTASPIAAAALPKKIVVKNGAPANGGSK